ncbi:MAG TPA: hypothetical protein VGN17_09355 [Bryobacteraceae bacterium]
MRPPPARDNRVPGFPKISVGSTAKVKALDPVTSAGPPTRAQVTECSANGIMIRTKRQILVGTVVQLHLQGDFSLWKIFCCVQKGDNFHLGLEFVEPVVIPDERAGR